MIDTQTIINYWEYVFTIIIIVIDIAITIIIMVAILILPKIYRTFKSIKNEDEDTLMTYTSIISIAILHGYTIITICIFIIIFLKNPDYEILKYFTILCIGILALHSIFTWKILETVKK